MILNDQDVALSKGHNSRVEARATQRFILSLGFDAKMFGRKVVAVIPEYNTAALETLQLMQWAFVS